MEELAPSKRKRAGSILRTKELPKESVNRPRQWQPPQQSKRGRLSTQYPQYVSPNHQKMPECLYHQLKYERRRWRVQSAVQNGQA
eukprot:44524-Pleurochrysis_carterae.AAC.2